MHRLHSTGVLLLAVSLMAPTGLAQDTTINNPDQSTPTTLYFHIFDTFNKFVVNTQPMDVEFFEVGGNSFPTLVGTPANDVTGQFDFNTIYGYSTAGPVEYDFIENGRPRFHPERGIAANIRIDASVEPQVFLYLDVRDIIGGDALPNYLPNFNLRVLMQEGDDPGLGARLDAGADIMEGHTIFDLADGTLDIESLFGFPPVPPVPGNDAFGAVGTNPATGNPIYIPDEDGIVEVQIPLEIYQDQIAKSEAYNIRIDWYQDVEGVLEEDQFAEGYFRLAAGQDHLPRLEMNIRNPVYMSFIHPQVAANTLLIHAGANSPWGTYDLDIANTTIEIDGPAEPQNLRQVLSTREHVHGLHDQDAQLTYLWDFREENAPDGEYTIRMTVTNDARTATASGEAKFIIEGDRATGIDTEGDVVEPTLGDDEKDTPAAGIVLIIGLLAAALVLRRRGTA